MAGRILLALLVLSGLAFPVVFPASPAHCEDTLTDGCIGTIDHDQVVIYYFHRKFRCQSCETLESVLPRILMDNYPVLLGNGELAMCVVDVDDSANSHFMDEFDILSNSVVLVEERAGKVLRYKNIEEVWSLSDDGEAVSHLIKKEIASFLSGS